MRTIDRAMTFGWLIYPALLFVLPNDLQVAGMAPETPLAALYFFLLLGSTLVSRTPVPTLDLPGLLPPSLLMFGLLTLILAAFKGDAADAIRVLSWMMVLVIGAVLFRNDQLRRSLWTLWFVLAVAQASVAFIKYGASMPEEVDLFAWTHRTVLGYFLAVGTVIGVAQLLQTRGLTQVVALAGTVICGACLAACLSRGAWLVALLGLVQVLRSSSRRARVSVIVGGGLLAIVSLLAGNLQELGERAETIYDWEKGSSNLYRLNLYFAAFRSLPEVWLLGAPSLDFGPFLAEHSVIRYPFYFDPTFAPDSDLIHVLLLGGVPLILIAAKAGLDLLRSLRAVASVGEFDGRWVLLILVSVQIVFDNIVSSALGWFYLGVIATVWPAIHPAGAINSRPLSATR